MTVKLCDVCRGTLSPYPFRVKIKKKLVKADMWLRGGMFAVGNYYRLQLCDDCESKMIRWMNGNLEENAALREIEGEIT